MARREMSRRHLIDFCKFVDTEFTDPPHIRFLAEKLEQVYLYINTRGRQGIGRLMINFPPRHGKTQTTSKRFPAWVLGHRHQWHIALVAYGDDFAADFSRAVRNLISENHEYHTLFPSAAMHPLSSAVQRWSLKDGDIDNPNLVATGIGGSLTGRGFHLIILDDLVKNRAEAESVAYRRNLHEAYRGTIRSRLEPGGAIVGLNTRWHEDDLPGWLMEQEKIGEGEHWEVINLPAIAGANDPIGRKPGEALWPERFDLEALAQVKIALGPYDWESEYQGNPKPPEGGHIKRQWLRIIPELPPQFRPFDGKPAAERLRWYRYWDLAITTKSTSDYTASARVAFDKDGNLYIADMIRGKFEWPEQKRILKETMLADKALGVRHGVESALHGIAAIQEFMRDPDLRGVTIERVDADTDKLSRALPWIGRAAAGKVFLVSGTWVSAFIDEASNFTGKGDAHDDQIDSISGGVAKLSGPSLNQFTDFYKRKSAEKVEPQTVAEREVAATAQRQIDEFVKIVHHAAETGMTIDVPQGMDSKEAGRVMAGIAGDYVDQGQDIKAIIVLEERRRLGV